MRFLELMLSAYGPFADAVIDLSEGSEGLHVIYGPNEAGKSSALRAVHAFLFGIHGQTRDAFMHSYRDLRVGARLADGTDTELVLWRRKGNKDTLLDGQGETVDEGVLTRLLGGIPGPVFENAFGIDHRRLVSGGEDLLKGEGEVGQSLFAAGLGSAGLARLLGDIDRECVDLFKGGKATKPKINALVSRYRRLTREIRECSLPGSEWTGLREAFSRSQSVLEGLERAWQRQLTELTRLRRLDRALPKLAERHRLLRKLEELQREGPLPDLRPGFEEERLEAEKMRDTNREVAERAATEAKRIVEQLNELNVPEELLAREADIDALYQERASHRKAESDRIRLEGRRLEHSSRAAQHLVQLRPGCDAQTEKPPSLSVEERRRVQELAQRHGALESALEAATRDVGRWERALSKVESTLEESPAVADPTALRAACARVGRDGDLEAEGLRLREDLAGGRREAAALLKSLGRWQGELEQVGALPVPAVTTIERFESEWEEITGAIRDLDSRIDASRERVQDLDTQLIDLERIGPVPQEHDLVACREQRDRGWRLIRRAWLDNEQVDESRYDAERALPDAYEHAVRTADEVVDRLRADAERVAAKAQLVGQKDEEHRRLHTLERERERLEADRVSHLSAWSDAWAEAGIEPLPPREMRSWLARYERLEERVRELGRAEVAHQSLMVRIESHVKDLLTELDMVGSDGAPDPAASLLALREHAQGVVEKLERSARERSELVARRSEHEEHVEEALAEAARARTALDGWRASWGWALEPLGMKASASPEQARAVLEVVEELHGELRQAGEVAARIEGIERDARVFSRRVGELVEELATDLREAEPEAAIQELQSRVAAAAQASSIRARLRVEVGARRAEAEAARAHVAVASDLLRRLCAEAGVDTPETLGPVEKRVREAVRHRERILEIEGELVREGMGASLNELEAEADGVEGDALAAQISAAQREQDELDRRRAEASERLGEDRQALSAVEATADAALLADEAESIAAELRAHSERYVRLRLARAILDREIERYRSANQGPLLARACRIFARVTCGAFGSLEPDYADDDTPVLLAVRASGERIPVEAMSDGTREQLYLALRLASLEQHLETGTALPLVVDDILLRSDDDRSRAILEALVDLSTTTQVLFFTHQRRHVELAQGLGRAGEVFVHRLSPGVGGE